jgi:cytochrome c
LSGGCHSYLPEEPGPAGARLTGGRTIRTARSIVLTILIAAAPLGAAAFAQTPSAQAGGDADAGKTVFGRCSACHAVGPNAENKAGPILNGIIGQKAGEVPGYSFSDAMKNSGIVWDDTTLATFLKSPRKAVPGTKMTFAGLPKAQDIANVIAYLNADPKP